VSFAATECGIERGATKVTFPEPPSVHDPDVEGAAEPQINLSIDASPVAVYLTKAQAKSRIKIETYPLTLTQVNVLRSLEASAEVATLKYKPSASTEVSVVFGPRSEQEFVPYNGPHPEGDETGAALGAWRTTYRVVLSLVLV